MLIIQYSLKWLQLHTERAQKLERNETSLCCCRLLTHSPLCLLVCNIINLRICSDAVCVCCSEDVQPVVSLPLSLSSSPAPPPFQCVPSHPGSRSSHRAPPFPLGPLLFSNPDAVYPWQWARARWLLAGCWLAGSSCVPVRENRCLTSTYSTLLLFKLMYHRASFLFMSFFFSPLLLL